MKGERRDILPVNKFDTVDLEDRPPKDIDICRYIYMYMCMPIYLLGMVLPLRILNALPNGQWHWYKENQRIAVTLTRFFQTIIFQCPDALLSRKIHLVIYLYIFSLDFFFFFFLNNFENYYFLVKYIDVGTHLIGNRTYIKVGLFIFLIDLVTGEKFADEEDIRRVWDKIKLVFWVCRFI